MSIQTWAESARHRENDEFTVPEIFLLTSSEFEIDGERLGLLAVEVIERLRQEVSDDRCAIAQVLAVALMRVLNIEADSLRRLGGDA